MSTPLASRALVSTSGTTDRYSAPLTVDTGLDPRVTAHTVTGRVVLNDDDYATTGFIDLSFQQNLDDGLNMENPLIVDLSIPPSDLRDEDQDVWPRTNINALPIVLIQAQLIDNTRTIVEAMIEADLIEIVEANVATSILDRPIHAVRVLF